DLAVQHVNQRVAADDDLHLLPVAIEPAMRLDGGLGVTGKLPEQNLAVARKQHADRAGSSDDAAPLTFVELTGVLIVRVDVELVAAHLPRVPRRRGCRV